MIMIRHLKIARTTAAGMALALMALLGVPQASAGGRQIYDHSYYRPVHGHARSIFHNPVGKLDTTITRRLPPLTVKPAEFDFGIKTSKLSSIESSSAKARRTNPALPAAPSVTAPLTGPQTVTPTAPQAPKGTP